MKANRGRGLALLLLLAGCGGGPAPEPRSYDLGLAAPGAKLPGVRVGAVRAVSPFDSTDMQYRLAYRDRAEIAAYANSRWAATPAELMRKQLLRASAEGVAKCALEVEIQEFSQVFAAKDASEARLELHARLAPAGVHRIIAIVEPNAGPDAPAGAAALSRAADRAVGELDAWVSSQPACR